MAQPALSDEQQDEALLQKFGYKQELRRTLGFVSNFAVAFSYISVSTGTFSLFYLGILAGGPAFFWTWPLMFLGQFAVALCFAELGARVPCAIVLRLYLFACLLVDRPLAGGGAVHFLVVHGDQMPITGGLDVTFDAASTLGCSYPTAIMRVLVPALGPAFLTSGMFAFLASMDNYPISIFFTDAWTKTLPIQMLQYVEESPDPTIAAISSGLILLAVLALLVGDRLVGLHRLADF